MTPKVLVMCCRKASTALESSGPLPEGVSVVRMPCTGRLDEGMALNGLRSGARVVLVLGCLKGNCVHVAGNLQAERRAESAKRMLADLGVDPARVVMARASPAGPLKARQAVRDALRTADELGPLVKGADP